MTTQEAASSAWDWTPDAVQFWAVVGLGLIAVLRQLIGWAAGYWRYGRQKLVVCRGDRTYKPHLARLTMRCPDHLEQSRHPDEVYDDNPMTYTQHAGDGDLVIRPVAVGTRLWSYEAVTEARIGWLGWMATCAWLALRRRFAEPDVDPCHYC